MKLEELRNEFELDLEVIEFCRRNGLHDLKNIQLHEAKHRGFVDMPGCDERIEKALLDLLTVVSLLDYGKLNDVTGFSRIPNADQPDVALESPAPVGNPISHSSRFNDPDLEHIVTLFNLSVRAYNVCDVNGLNTLSAIESFERENGGFSKLRNCGKKTEMELFDLLVAARNSRQLSTETDEVQKVDDAVLQRIFMTQYMRLSHRARKILDVHIGEPKAKNAIRFFMEQGRKMRKLPSAASVTMTELRSMRDHLLIAANAHAITVSNGAPTEKPNELKLWRRLNNIPEESTIYLHDQHGELTVLRFIRHLLAVQDTSKAGQVYHAYLGILGGERSFQALADDVSLSRERIRRIIERIDREYPQRLAFLHDLPGVRERYPMLVTQGTLLVVSQVIRDELNEREGTDCSCLFIAMMAQVFSGLEYELGNWRWFDLSVSRVKELQHQFPFVVRSSQVSELEVIMKDLIDRATQPRTTTLTLDAYSLIPNKSSLNRDELVHATIDLAQCLFPDIQVQGAQLLLQPNKKRKQEDILLEILLELDEPSHASLIVERWNELVPERPVTIDIVRSVAIRNKELFFSISRDSTYGLRQWERDRPMLKSGTLRDIVEEELEGSHRPLHISELTLAISRYRKDTNSSSVRTNLSLDRSGRFITMPQGFFGLAKRQYPEQRSDLRNIPSSLLRSSVLRKYIGVSLTKLVDYIVDHGKVHRDIVLATVHLLINEGRLILGPDKNIIHVTSDPLESGQAESFNDELPFPEG